ncbi:MAG: hypothetical protein ACYDA5_03255 [Vulcanimicrobiaceae bacterium]
MMFAHLSLIAALASGSLVAQVSPAMPASTPTPIPLAAPIPGSATVFNNGPCLDSRPVPKVLQPPITQPMQIVGIEKVVSTATMTQGEVIGFLYTLADGTTWFGQRAQQYMSAADAGQANQVLASTHLPSDPVTAFPPQTKYGVKTKYQEFFQVRIPAAALAPLQVSLESCVAWPANQPLPDPAM